MRSVPAAPVNPLQESAAARVARLIADMKAKVAAERTASGTAAPPVEVEPVPASHFHQRAPIADGVQSGTQKKASKATKPIGTLSSALDC